MGCLCLLKYQSERNLDIAGKASKFDSEKESPVIRTCCDGSCKSLAYLPWLIYLTWKYRDSKLKTCLHIPT